MKEFLKTINWRAFAVQTFGVFAFFCLSYLAGNNKFPHNVWTVPVGTVVVEGLVLLQHYFNLAMKKEKEKRNGTNNG